MADDGGKVRQFTRIIAYPGLPNLGVVEQNKVYRSAQPTRYGPNLPFGILSYFNLRDEDQRAEVEDFWPGTKYFQLRLNILSDVTIEDFDLIVHTLSNPENQPILVHCQSGADRTGVACAAYRMAVDAWTLDEAWEELQCYGGGIHAFLNLKLKYHLQKYAEAKGYW